MTTQALHRCLHCGTPYYYQPSGYGCGRKENHGKYCPECAIVYLEAVKSAFQDVPRKFESIWVETQDVDALTVESWRTERAANARADGKLVIFRESSPLFNLDDPSDVNRCGYELGQGDFKGRYFKYNYWTKRGEHRVEEQMEQDMETGELVPWKRLPPRG